MLTSGGSWSRTGRAPVTREEWAIFKPAMKLEDAIHKQSRKRTWYARNYHYHETMEPVYARAVYAVIGLMLGCLGVIAFLRYAPFWAYLVVIVPAGLLARIAFMARSGGLDGPPPPDPEP
jgi:hypothetical protein